jgi:hypothetical protein
VSGYIRPPLPKQVYYDAAGAVIDYGNRWLGRSPPEEAYSLDSNRQRFAPLHTVADALIEHLRRSYAVTVSEATGFAGDLMHERDDVLRAARIIPASPDAAALTFVFTSYPSVIVHAGLLHDFPFPQCGCDACDESAETLAGELEWTVLAVVAGGYSERFSSGIPPRVGYEIANADGTHRSSEGRPEDCPTDRLREAKERLRRLPGGWQPWASV